MREVGIADTANGLEITFSNIIQIAHKSKFADCTHIHEKGCAVLDALEKGTINKVSYEILLKIVHL
jgi:ribosome biogenesis GTPase